MSSYIILSAGIGRNMKGAGCKSLIQIGSVCLIDKQISTILKYDKEADIIIVGGFEYQKLVNYIHSKKYNVRIVLNSNFATTSQAESLKIGINSCKKSAVYIIHGDIYFDINSLNFPDNKKAWITISDKMGEQSVGTVIREGLIKNMCYGLENKWGQIAFFPEKNFDTIRDSINNIRSNRLTYEFINNLPIDIFSHCDESIEINRKYENISNLRKK